MIPATEVVGAGWVVEIWRPEGQAAAVRFRVARGPAGKHHAEQVAAGVAAEIRRAMVGPRCCGFTVTVHPVGPDCDHEVGP